VSAPRPVFEQFDERWAARAKANSPSRTGIDGYLGIRLEEFTPGRLVAAFDVRDDLVTMIGNIHGGCVTALVDHCLGVVMYPVMPPRSWAATTEFKVNLMAPVSSGTVRAEAEIVSMSRRLAVVRVEVVNVVPTEAAVEPTIRLVALAQGTCTIVAPKGS
jgi:1,4-dihydroxy-2-naphthoyl-CoA hydrolase